MLIWTSILTCVLSEFLEPFSYDFVVILSEITTTPLHTHIKYSKDGEWERVQLSYITAHISLTTASRRQLPTCIHITGTALFEISM